LLEELGPIESLDRVTRLQGSYPGVMVRFAVAAALIAVIVAFAATIDHRHKRQVEFAAQEAAWFCAHGRQSSCSDFDEAAYERRWEDRERVYRIAFFTLSAFALVGGLVGPGDQLVRNVVRRRKRR
jgi:hypothetical protein